MKYRYLYGMRLRGFSPGCQPKDGFVECLTETTGNIKLRQNYFERYYALLIYDRKLSETELAEYELNYLDSYCVEYSLFDREGTIWGIDLSHGEDI
jgi:hypothetical protein